MIELLPAFSDIFLPIALGLICRNGSFVPVRSRPVIQQFATRVAIPFLVFNSMRSIDLNTAEQFLPMTLGFVLFMGLVWLMCSLVIAALARRSKWVNRYKAELIIMGFGGNLGYICWKLHEILIGSEGLQRGIFYTTFYWPVLILYSFLTLFVLKLHQEKKLDKQSVLYSTVPMLILMAAGFFLGIKDIAIPGWLEDFTMQFGNLAVPTTLFCLGLSISVHQSVRSAVTVVPYLLIRLALWIIATALLLQLPLFDGTSRQVLMISALAPLGVNPLVIGDMFGLDTDFIASTTTISTVYFLILLPLLFMFWPY